MTAPPARCAAAAVPAGDGLPPVVHRSWCGPDECTATPDVDGVRVEYHQRTVLQLGPVEVHLVQMVNVFPDGHTETDGSPRALLIIGWHVCEELPLSVAGQVGAALIGAQHLDGHVDVFIPRVWGGGQW